WPHFSFVVYQPSAWTIIVHTQTEMPSSTPHLTPILEAGRLLTGHLTVDCHSGFSDLSRRFTTPTYTRRNTVSSCAKRPLKCSAVRPCTVAEQKRITSAGSSGASCPVTIPSRPAATSFSHEGD